MASDVASLALRVDALEVSAASRELKKLQDSAQGAEKSSNQLGSATAFLVDNYKALVGTLAGLKITGLIQESVLLNQRYQELGITMQAVGRNAGISTQELDAQAEAVRKSGISMIESRSIITKLISANIDLSNATKLARLAQDAAVVGQLNSSDALNSLVHGITSAQVDVLRTIGINVNFERSYADLAKQMGVTTNALTEQQKTQARLNVVLGEAATLTGVYEASLANAGKQLRSSERLVEDLKVKLGGLFDDAAKNGVSAYTEVLKELDDEITQITNSGQLKEWSRQAAIEFAFLADVARNSFNIVGGLIAMTGDQLTNIKNFDFGAMSQTFAMADKNLIAALQDTTKYRDAVNSRIIQEDLLSEKVTGQNNNLRKNKEEVDKNAAAQDALAKAKKKAAEDADNFLKSLKEEAAEAGLTKDAILRLQAAHHGVTAEAVPLINTIKQVSDNLERQKDLAAQVSRDMDRVKSITQDVATTEELFIQKQNELNRLLSTGLLDPGTYFRALEKAGDEMRSTLKGGNDDIQQLQFAIQGWGRQASEALVDFAISGKGSFSDFATSVIKDIARMYIQMKLITPLLQSLPGLNFGGGTASASTSAASSVFSNLFKGGRANGGPVYKNSLYQVNERGMPELFQSGNKQFLLTGNQPGNVVAPGNGGFGGFGGGMPKVLVNIIEAPGKGGETSQRQTSNGLEIDVMVDQLVAKKTREQGSATNKSLRQNFGMSDNLVMR